MMNNSSIFQELYGKQINKFALTKSFINKEKHKQFLFCDYKEFYYLCINYQTNKKTNTMGLYFTGIIIAVSCFLLIGLFHPIVIKTEYYFGTRYWWVFLIVGIACLAAALFIENPIISALLGIFGASSLWSIKELFEQRDRVKKGWFPMNPKRTNEY